MKRHTLNQENGVLTLNRKPSPAGLIFGIPTLGGGCAIVLFGLLTSLGAITSGSPAQALSGMLGLALGTVFTGLGAAGIFARSGTLFDVQSQLVTQWIKVLPYSRTTKTPLAGFEELVVDEHLWKGRPRYSLFLAGSSRLKILTTRRGSDMVELAERIATLLAMPINNQSRLRMEQLS